MKVFIAFFLGLLLTQGAFAKTRCNVISPVCGTTLSVTCNSTKRISFLDLSKPGLHVRRFRVGYIFKMDNGLWYNERTCGTINHPDNSLLIETFRSLQNPGVNLALMNRRLGALREAQPETLSLAVLQALDKAWYCPIKHYTYNLDHTKVAILSLDLDNEASLTEGPTCQ